MRRDNPLRVVLNDLARRVAEVAVKSTIEEAKTCPAMRAIDVLAEVWPNEYEAWKHEVVGDAD